MQWQAQNKVVLQAGKYSYTQKQYNELIAQAAQIKVNESDARKAIINSISARAAADETGVTYSTESIDLLQAIRERSDEKVDNPSEYQKVAAYADLVETAVMLQENGGYKFTLLDFPFSRYIVGFQNDAFGDEKLIGNEAEIRKDIEYAKEQKQKYTDLLTSKSKTEDEIVASIKADNRLVNGQYSNQSKYMIISLDGVQLDTNTPFSISDELLRQVERAAKQKNQPYTTEQLFSSSSEGYGLGDMSEITRENGTVVGWRVITVSESVVKDSGIRSKYETQREDYQKNAEV